MAMQHQEHSEQDILDVSRHHRIQDVLTCLDVVDDVISLIQTYAKQSKLMFLVSKSQSRIAADGGTAPHYDPDDDSDDGYDEIDYKPSSTIWLFDPSSSSWDSFQLNMSPHNSFMSDVTACVWGGNQVTTITERDDDDDKEDDDEKENHGGGMIQKTLNLCTAQVTKTIIPTHDTKELSLPSYSSSSSFSFKGYIHVFIDEFSNTPPIFLNVKTKSFMKIPSLSILHNNAIIISDYLICSAQHDRVFAFFASAHNFYEVLIDTTIARHPPPFGPFEMACYVMSEKFIYMNRCVDGHSGEWHRYDMDTDRWSLMPRKRIWTGQIKRGVSEIFADIIDHTLFVFYRPEGEDKYHMHAYNLSQSDDTGEWEEVEVTGDGFVNSGKSSSLLICNAMFGI